MILHPFFSYFGAKFHMARRLGMPQRDCVIEPFAGGACYSTYWATHAKRVILLDIDPVVVAVWRYLIKVRESEIVALPADISDISELSACQEAKWLVGFWFNKGLARPAVRRSNWARQPKLHGQFWSERTRTRIAHQLKYIRHWQVIEGSYENAPDIEAHWHIDPPYQRAGYSYKYSDVDYPALARWCLSRKGFVQVCEHTAADWLPFVEFARTKGTHGKARAKIHSEEGVYQFGRPRMGIHFEQESKHHADAKHQKRVTDGNGAKAKVRKSSRLAGADKKGQRAARGAVAAADRAGAELAQRRLRGVRREQRHRLA